MPVTQNAANPFFGNIRQNMDLIGGVGQMPVKQPANMSRYIEDRLPDWLKAAADEKDKGARVAEKFLHIEKREQKRMQEALSGKVSYGSPTQSMPKSAIQIAGIEKGSKNRYNNIWPFEHTRVKLQGVPSHGCDYFNANHITSGRTNKRYIATQGPIPATFSVCSPPPPPPFLTLSDLLSGFLECCVATRCSRHCHAHGREGRRSSKGSQLLGRQAVWPNATRISIRETSVAGSGED